MALVKMMKDDATLRVHESTVAAHEKLGWRVCNDQSAPEASKAEEIGDDDGSDAEGLHVGKGPRGMWYVIDGKERISEGFATEDEARAALEELNG